MKGCLQWNIPKAICSGTLFNLKRFSPQAGVLDQQVSAELIELWGHLGCPMMCHIIWIYTVFKLTSMHSEWPKLHRVLAILTAIGVNYIFSIFRAL